MIEAGLHFLAHGLRWLRQRRLGPVELPASTWALTEEEREGLARPLAQIAARRSPAGELPSDVVDGIAAGVVGVQFTLRSAVEEAAVLDALRGQTQEMPDDRG